MTDVCIVHIAGRNNNDIHTHTQKKQTKLSDCSAELAVSLGFGWQEDYLELTGASRGRIKQDSEERQKKNARASAYYSVME